MATKTYACENCKLRAHYDKSPRSLMGRFWRWHINFCPGWKAFIVLLMCIPFYVLSFAQMALPISVEAKGVLWFSLFGLAKTCQYGGLTILGVEGVKRLKAKFGKGKEIKE